MEEVYVVKVRSKPCASRLFPSERRYSACTVGGLGAIHLLLALICLLLGSLHVLALPGPTPGYGAVLGLGAAAAVAGLAGVLAWSRWYVDNNIRWFFVSSSVSGLSALLCIALTAATLAVSQENISRLRLPLTSTPTAVIIPEQVSPYNSTQAVEYPEAAELGDNLPSPYYGDTDVALEEPHLVNDSSTSSPDGGKNEVRSVVAINIIVASTLELVWSVLSAKIAWKGMMNPYPDDGEGSADSPDIRKEEEKKKQQQKEVMGNKPDIICNHKRRTAPKIEDRRDSGVSHEPMPRSVQDDGPCLPPMERTMDFQEKIHRFLESNREHYLNMNARDM